MSCGHHHYLFFQKRSLKLESVQTVQGQSKMHFANTGLDGVFVSLRADVYVGFCDCEPSSKEMATQTKCSSGQGKQSLLDHMQNSVLCSWMLFIVITFFKHMVGLLVISLVSFTFIDQLKNGQ